MPVLVWRVAGEVVVATLTVAVAPVPSWYATRAPLPESDGAMAAPAAFVIRVITPVLTFLTKMSDPAPFAPGPAARFVAVDSKATRLPSSLTDGDRLAPLGALMLPPLTQIVFELSGSS